jgi:hypothetical protein
MNKHINCLSELIRCASSHNQCKIVLNAVHAAVRMPVLQLATGRSRVGLHGMMGCPRPSVPVVPAGCEEHPWERGVSTDAAVSVPWTGMGGGGGGGGLEWQWRPRRFSAVICRVRDKTRVGRKRT